jgi:long-chain acyl-CoA synthetase
MKERTLAQIVENFHLRGEDIAYVRRCGYRVRRWTYRRVADSIYQLSRELQERDIHHGDKVFLWGEDCAEWVICFFASILRGAIVVPMDRAASLEFAQQVCIQTRPKLCFCSQGQPRIDPSLPELQFDHLSEVLCRHSATPPALVDLQSQDPVEIVFTSGATADPKGVVLSHKNILTNLDPIEREIAKYIKYERIVHPLRFLSLLPLSHVFGQFLGLFIPQMMGSTVLFQDTLNPSDIIRTIKRERVSVLITVPRMMDSLRDKIERDLELTGSLSGFKSKFDETRNMHFLKRWWRFRSIHRQFGWKFWAFISGGASLSAETEQFWALQLFKAMV